MKKKLYHLCASAPEIMFRVPEDYIQGINRACLSAYRHDTHLLAYAFMSNHFHIIAETANPDVYIGSIRNGYTKWFNHKYGRQGPLGYISFHSVELTTADHILDGITYVLRNGVHHNIAHYPSGYPYSSAKYYFMKDFGLEFKYNPVLTWKEQREHLPWATKLPPGFTLDNSGLLIQEHILQSAMVEHYYGTARNFSYFMNKTSAKEWATLNIESWMGEKAKELIDKERYNSRVKKVNDIQICLYIDAWLSKNKRGASYVTLTRSEKMSLAKQLMQKRATTGQIQRCLAISAEDMSSSI